MNTELKKGQEVLNSKDIYLLSQDIKMNISIVVYPIE